MDERVDIAPGLSLPSITWEAVGTGAAVLLLALVAAVSARFAVRSYLRWRGRSPSAASVFSRVAFWLIVAIGVGTAVTVIFPSVQPVDLLGGIGVISIAAGIAFQTVLGNMFAGLVLLSRDDLTVGDQVDVDGVRGTITAMALTTTTVRTFDGRQVLIPNSSMHSSVVAVQTGYETVRTSVRLDLDDTTDVGIAKNVALAAMNSIDEVASQPEPEALLVEVGTGTLALELRFWSGARQLETLEAQDAVITAAVQAFRRHGVRTGTRVQVVEAAESLQRALDAIEIIPARRPKEDLQ
jgi:small conductance mechanosensitive channel